jgi:3-deoxy-D-manno-octulosonic-acid transferase
MKSDVLLPEMNHFQREALRQELSISKKAKVYIAGSTHPGEDTRLLQVFKQARAKDKTLVLIIAPRHPHRADELERTCRELSLSFTTRSRVPVSEKWEVMILDTIGELVRFYAFSDCAFVGGSLVPKGGQNLMEPAYYAKPIFFGPHMDNFSALAHEFLESNAARAVKNDEDLLEMFLWKDRASLQAMGKKARIELDGLQGATDKTIEVIEGYMKKVS